MSKEKLMEIMANIVQKSYNKSLDRPTDTHDVHVIIANILEGIIDEFARLGWLDE